MSKSKKGHPDAKPMNRWRVARLARESGRVIRSPYVGTLPECQSYLKSPQCLRALDDGARLVIQQLYGLSDMLEAFRADDWRTEDKPVEPPPRLRSWRVEASVPAITLVEAHTREEAIALACGDRDGWDIDLSADIDAEHVESCVEDDDT